MMKTEDCKILPLHKEHLKLGARLVPFGGFIMPIQYEGILAEYHHTRESVSLFDTSHMGEFIFQGDAFEIGLDQCVTCRIKDMPVESCRYGFLLNEKGRIIDDMIIFRLEEEKWMMVVNAATILKDEQHLRARIKRKDVLENISDEIAKIDVQGPQSRDVLASTCPEIKKLSFYAFGTFHLMGENCIISRTGYTGELGYEIYFPAKKIKELWQKLLENDKVKPAGLGARDLLRLEMGYSLYGQDLDETITPIEAGLKRFVDSEKEFIGQKALCESSTNQRKKIFFVCESRRCPRHGFKIMTFEGKDAGSVTSGGFSPALQKGIGMGLIAGDVDIAHCSLLVDYGNKKESVKITRSPFYRNGSLHQR